MSTYLSDGINPTMMSHPNHNKVLLVEDDKDIRDALTEVLELEGFSVACAANGQEAIDHLRTSEPPRLILLDLMMPVKDGYIFRREQMEDPLLSQIPVVLMSAGNNIHQIASSIQVNGYLKKPVELDDLIETVKNFAA